MERELERLRYAELQQLAKRCGLKANLKADKLLKHLREHFQQEQKGDAALKATEGTNECSTTDVEKGEDSCVTKRRGKGRLPNKSKGGENGNQNESVHLQAVTTSENEQPSTESSPLSEKCQNTEGSDSKRRQRKRRAEFELSMETGAESIGSVTDGSAAVTPCTHLPPEREASTSKGTAAQSKTVFPSGKIPRYVGAARKTVLKSPIAGGKAGLNHVTPDWKKIHQARFNKMESIDLYVERKRKRIEAFGNSIKQVKMLAENSLPQKASKIKIPDSNMKKSMNGPQDLKSTPSLFSPAQQTAKIVRLSTPANRRKSLRSSVAAANASTLNEKSVFNPSVCSVTKMNVRFTDTTKDNENKHSVVKTPARMSPYTELPSTPGTEEVKKVKPVGPKIPEGQKEKPTDTSTTNPTQAKVVTPYRFSGSTTPGTNKKFDLKASLSRPLRYKPHKGKLKTWGEMKENNMDQSKSLDTSAYSHKKDHKQPKLQTRVSRREKFVEERKERKNHVMGARRGLVMA
ncbi:nucleolar and spindle-associated protein 1 [Heptranchias perlo]|uniref:nucleolar and spindle-associated protein 1 n=1 Tax=Heptranchias perlo TaxID=212740 RepID=UPI003559AB7D